MNMDSEFIAANFGINKVKTSLAVLIHGHSAVESSRASLLNIATVLQITTLLSLLLKGS